MAMNGHALLLLRFLALFSGGAALVLFWVTLESLYIKRLTIAYLFEFSLPATLALLAGMVAVLEGYVWLRLRLVGRLAAGQQTAGRDDAISRVLLRLPVELFWWTVAYALLFIPFYHVVHYAFEGHSLVQVDDYYRLNFVRSFLYELTISMSAAILHYAVARRLIRPALMGLPHAKGELLKGRSFLAMLTTTFCVLLLVSLFSILWYVLVARVKAHPVEFRVLAWLVALELIFALCIFVLLTSQFRRELLVLTDSLRSLLAGRRRQDGATMPILSDDEVGQLAVTFNRLHERMNREYEEVAGELRLARQFQEQLLPPAQMAIGTCDIAALSEPRMEVGSGFYDVIPLEGGKFAVVAGEVSGEGLPAALQMSALLLLLRAEIDRGGSPGEMLDRFRLALSDVFPQEAGMSAALAVVDGERMRVSFAVDGDAGIWTSRRHEQSHVRDMEADYLPGDSFCLYSKAAERALIAPEGTGERLLRLSAAESLDGQLEDELERFRSHATEESGDFTMLLVSYRQREEDGGA